MSLRITTPLCLQDSDLLCYQLPCSVVEPLCEAPLDRSSRRYFRRNSMLSNRSRSEMASYIVEIFNQQVPKGSGLRLSRKECIEDGFPTATVDHLEWTGKGSNFALWARWEGGLYNHTVLISEMLDMRNDIYEYTVKNAANAWYDLEVEYAGTWKHLTSMLPAQVRKMNVGAVHCWMIQPFGSHVDKKIHLDKRGKRKSEKRTPAPLHQKRRRIAV